MKSNNKSLTKAEEQIMQSLWKLKKGFLRDIIDSLPPPKPHQNTVATINETASVKDPSKNLFTS